MRKILALLLIPVLLLPNWASAADVPDEQWSIMSDIDRTMAQENDVSLLGISIEDNSNISERVSKLVGRLEGPARPSPTRLRLCTSIGDEFCGESKAQYFTAILPPCKNASQANCIVGLEATRDGVKMTGTLLRNFPEKGYTDFPASTANNLPQGSTPSIWSFPALENGGGTSQYLVNFIVEGDFEGDNKAQIRAYDAGIYPISIKSGAYGRNQAKDASSVSATGECEPNAGCAMRIDRNSKDNNFICASVEDGACALRQSFPANVRFKLLARLSQSPIGWLHGRLRSPEIKVSPIGNGVNISVEAEPVVVPVVGLLKDYSKLPEAMQTKYKSPTAVVWGSGSGRLRPNMLMVSSPASEEAFEALETWKEFIKDKASASPTSWTVRTLRTGSSVSPCFKSTTELIGVVSTNSMVYLGSPPEFNKDSQSLDYKVASPHLTSKGEVFKGTYDLQLKSDVARCLYGFKNAPISASISVVKDSGSTEVSTTLLSQKDGWLHLGAYGFTFSSPTIQVKLTQDANAVEEVSAKPLTSKKTTVTCIKGKMTKKVSGIKPKCPAGYKKR